MKRPNSAFNPGTLWDNLTAAADLVGFQNADIALALARVPWDSIEDRDNFLYALVAPRAQDFYQGGSVSG